LKKFARSLLFLITLFIVGSAVMPVSANAQRRRYRRHYHRRPYHRPPPRYRR
jgi:hypothetical protein